MMKNYWKNIVYPIICFFSLVLSLVVIAKLAGRFQVIIVSPNLAKTVQFISMIVYVLLIVASSYLLTKSLYLGACVAAIAIFIFSILYLLISSIEFALLIYYFLYAAVIGVIAFTELRKE